MTKASFALWLGHESIETTHGYVEADLASKQRTLEKLAPAQVKFSVFSLKTICFDSWPGSDYSACNHDETHISRAIAAPARNNQGLGITIHGMSFAPGFAQD